MLADDGSLVDREHVASSSLHQEDVVAYGDGESVYPDRVASEHVETLDSVPGELAA